MDCKEKTLARANRIDRIVHKILQIIFAILFACIYLSLKYNNLMLCEIYLALAYGFTVISVVYDIWLHFVFMGITYTDERY